MIFDFNQLAFLLFCFFALWVFLFRNPDREAKNFSSNAFLSPIDGRVTRIASEGDYVYVNLDVGLFDIGVLRAPIEIVSYQFFHIHGSPLCLSSKASLLSPKIEINFGDHQMKIRQQLFHIHPLEPQNQFLQGERMGFLKQGKVELKMKKIELKINVDDRLKGGESVIGYLQ